MRSTMVAGAALAALLATAGGAAVAQGMRGAGPLADFATLDADGDGRVTAEEIAAQRAARFAALDADGDGAVSRQEFMDHAAARAGGRAGEMFDRLDADGDGVLSRDAIEARRGMGPDAGRLIERFDADGDGAVTEAEIAEARERMQGRMGRHGGDGPRWHGGRQSDG